MREVILIRHGLTRWNLEGRIQGQSDIPLCDAGISQVRGWTLDERYQHAKWYVSTLRRTRETARLLGVQPVARKQLMEMNWGEWTGRRVADLREELGSSMQENERRGLDFQPPGGESPRMVRTRFAGWLGGLPESGGPVCVVTHKGVIRAAISLATGWDLTSDFGEKLTRNGMHRFYLDGGSLILDRLNLPLDTPAD